MGRTDEIVQEMNEVYPALKNLMTKSAAANNPNDAPRIKEMCIKIRILHQELIDLHTKELNDIENTISMLSQYTASSD